MSDPDSIKSIKEDLSRISEARDAETVHLLIQSINRSIRKLTSPGKGGSEVLTRLGMDLLESYKSEKALLALSGKNKTLSEGFYKSFLVLRADLEKALNGLNG